MPEEIRHEPERLRFVMEISGAEAVLQYRPAGADTLDYYRTYVPDALRGRGLASQITGRALEFARDAALKVIPTCPFVATYIERHPQYRDLVAK